MRPKRRHGSTQSKRLQLRFGPYRTPRFRYGSIVHCEALGQVEIIRLSDGRIPWPKGRKVGGTAHGFVLYRDLAKAVRNEAGLVVCHWWGVSMNAVTQSTWRRAKAKGTHAFGPSTTARIGGCQTERLGDVQDPGSRRAAKGSAACLVARLPRCAIMHSAVPLVGRAAAVVCSMN